MKLETPTKIIEEVQQRQEALKSLSPEDLSEYAGALEMFQATALTDSAADDYQRWIGPERNGDPREHIYFGASLMLIKDIPKLMADVRSYRETAAMVSQVAYFDTKSGHHSFVCQMHPQLRMMVPGRFPTEDDLQAWLSVSAQVREHAGDLSDEHMTMFVSDYEKKYGNLPTPYELELSSRAAGRPCHWIPRNAQPPTFEVRGSYGELTVETLTGKVTAYDADDPDQPEYINVTALDLDEFVAYWGVYPTGGGIYDINDFGLIEFHGEAFQSPNMEWRQEREAMLKTQKGLDNEWKVGYGCHKE